MHHVMPMASSMKPLHSLGQDDRKEVQPAFWSFDSIHVSVGITQCHQLLNGTIAFLRSRLSKYDET